VSALVASLVLALVIALGAQAVAFQRATVCRQEAWLRSTELLTGALLSDAPAHAASWHPGCNLRVWRNRATVVWRRDRAAHPLELQLRGAL
jgi:hypothetical protein